MANQGQNAASLFDINLTAGSIALVLLVLIATTIVATPAAQAQTGTVLHNFTNGSDGGSPEAGVTFDQQGRIYGTASNGGSNGQGVVYRLVHESDGWLFSPIYSFGSRGHDGSDPEAKVIFGPNGVLYGTTYQGGAENRGTVFSLQPPASACKAFLCSWVETVLYSFTGGADGAYPQFGDLAFDQAGNIYGTTGNGGSGTGCESYGCGVVFKLTRSGSGWTESVLWNFTGGNDGAGPLSGVIFDSAGNLYGTTGFGGSIGFGTVYELSPTQSGWIQTTLYSFTSNDYGNGAGGLIMDAQGDLFGITGDLQSGAAYELKPQNGSWSFILLQSFTGLLFTGPLTAPTFDSQGNLYGPLPNGGSEENGEIFKLFHAGDQWIYTPFYQFAGSDLGAYPIGAVTFDASGNMYGTSSAGGTGGEGTVWEITP